MTADAFLSEKEAVVKNLGINLLNLVFFNQVGEFLGPLGWDPVPRGGKIQGD